MSQPRTALIGLAGGPGAGKDTVAGLLAEQYGFRPHAFADALRSFVYATDDGWRQAFDLHGYHDAKWQVAGFRDRLIEVGEAAREWIAPDVWVHSLRATITPLLEAGTPVVVSDVRYRNEAAMIRDMGGMVVGVERPYVYPETAEAWDVFLGADEWIFNECCTGCLECDLKLLLI